MKDSFPLQSDSVSYNDGRDFNKLLIDVCAFANQNGGLIYCGVNAKGKIIGIEPISFIEQFQTAITNSFLFPVSCKYESQRIGHKYIVQLRIEKSPNVIQLKLPPEDVNIYYRIDAHTIIASKIIVSLLKMQKGLSSRDNVFNDEVVISIISLIQNETGLSLSQIYSKSNLPKSEIDRLLPQLLYLKRIFIRWNGKKIVFISQ